MEKVLLDSDLSVVILLLAFITGLLTKRIIPWWVHDDALEKLKAYEDAAPKLISEIQNLMDMLHEGEDEQDDPQKRRKPYAHTRRKANRANKQRGNYD